MTGSIRRRLLVGTALAVSLAFLASGALVLVLTRASLRAQLDDALVAKARALSALVEQERDEIESELGHTPELATVGDVFEVWDERSRIVARSGSLRGRDLVPAAVHRAGDAILDDVTLADGVAGRQVTLRFFARAELEELAGHPRQAVTIAVARSLADVDEASARICRVLIGVGIGGTIMCLLVLAWIVRFGLAPLRSLATAIAEVREGDLAARLATASTPEELRPVVDRLNELLARLGIAFSRERELTAEVAHELRTPLAGLRVTIEVALDRERSPERYRSSLAECLTICTQTERVVEALLSLSRLDAGTIRAAFAPVEVDELVREVLAQHSARAGERTLVVTSALPAVTVCTDREKLRVIIDNVVDNAVTYADAGGTVEIELSSTMLRVSNTGCELTKDQLAHVFERCWRGDEARATGTHAGLGLTLSRKLAELLDLEIGVAAETGRFIATIALPRGKQP